MVCRSTAATEPKGCMTGLKDENNQIIILNHLPQGKDRYFFWIVGHWPVFKCEQNVFPILGYVEVGPKLGWH